MTEDEKRRAFHRHPMVIDARKQYRLDLSAGMPEKAAWAHCYAILHAVRLELDDPNSENKAVFTANARDFLKRR